MDRAGQPAGVNAKADGKTRPIRSWSVPKE